jgi:hypothetical protein
MAQQLVGVRSVGRIHYQASINEINKIWRQLGTFSDFGLSILGD